MNGGYIEEVLGSKVMVGPMDSYQLPGFIRKRSADILQRSLGGEI